MEDRALACAARLIGRRLHHVEQLVYVRGVTERLHVLPHLPYADAHIYIPVSAHIIIWQYEAAEYAAVDVRGVTERLHTAAPAVCRGGTYIEQYEAARYAAVCGSYRSAAVHVRGVAQRQHMLPPLP